MGVRHELVGGIRPGNLRDIVGKSIFDEKTDAEKRQDECTQLETIVTELGSDEVTQQLLDYLRANTNKEDLKFVPEFNWGMVPLKIMRRNEKVKTIQRALTLIDNVLWQKKNGDKETRGQVIKHILDFRRILSYSVSEKR